MGVIRNNFQVAPVISVSEESINSLGIYSEPNSPPPEPVALKIGAPIQRRNPKLLLQRLQSHVSRDRLGARKLRRVNNDRELQILAEDEDEWSGEPSIQDLRPKTETAFTQILNNFANMRVWQYFISCTEEDQHHYLEMLNKSNKTEIERRSDLKQNIVLPSESNEEGKLKVEGPAMEEDSRSFHPAASAEQRFYTVQPNLRHVLKRKHIPVGVLARFEEDIIDMFYIDPSTVYIADKLSSFERLLLHALCQYNLLHSHSTDMGKLRKTKIENRKPFFIPPELSLTRFLEERNEAKHNKIRAL